MASPMLDGRSLNPREKAHFSLHISDRISKSDSGSKRFSSVKFNHKPSQTTSARSTTLAQASGDRYTLKLEDREDGRSKDIFTFTGQKSTPKKSYVLLFDPTSQRATLEPLDSTYTFNLSTKNKTDISSTYPKIYPRKPKDNTTQEPAAAVDLVDEPSRADNDNDEPDPNNPYDFRHFLKAQDKEKRGDESEYAFASSPDYRTGTGSAVNTPLLSARSKPTPATLPKPQKRKAGGADPLLSRKATAKKAQATPTVRLDRRASTHPKASSTSTSTSTSRHAKKQAPPAPTSKIKSAETVHSSDESSDADAEGDPVSSPAGPTHRSPSPIQRSPSPGSSPSNASRDADHDSDNDEDAAASFGLEIEVPDAAPKPRAIASLGLGQSIGLGSLSHLRSPSNGPISLASAANSVEGSPNPAYKHGQNRGRDADDGVIDFGNVGADDENSDGEDGYEDYGEDAPEEDRDVEPMDIGPPAQTQSTGGAQQPSRKMSVGGMAVEDEEDDPLYKEMMEGLAGGESSEESEEE